MTGPRIEIAGWVARPSGRGWAIGRERRRKDGRVVLAAARYLTGPRAVGKTLAELATRESEARSATQLVAQLEALEEAIVEAIEQGVNVQLDLPEIPATEIPDRGPLNHLKPQAADVLRYIDRHGSITQWDALRVLGCRSLTARIRELREAGYEIVTERDPHARYRLAE